MKRFVLILAVVAVTSFALGQAAPKVKFPWLNDAERDKLNAPCDKTMLEWKCAANAIHNRSQSISGLRLVELVAAPTEQGLAVTAVVMSKSGMIFAPTAKPDVRLATSVRRKINTHVERLFCSTDVAQGTIIVRLHEVAAGTTRRFARGQWDVTTPAPRH